MEFHGNPWKSMEIHGLPWKSTEIHGIPWNFYGVSMDYPWSSMECHGVPRSSMKYWWSSMECHEILWSFLGGPWNSREYCRVPWNAMGFPEVLIQFHGMPYSVSMEFNWIPCSLYEKIHRNSVIKKLINSLTTCSSLHFLLDRKIGNIWTFSKSKIVDLV